MLLFSYKKKHFLSVSHVTKILGYKNKQFLLEWIYSAIFPLCSYMQKLPLSPDAPGLHELMREVVEGRKMETENAHHWRQTKHLLRYVKAQEREIGKTER